MVRLVVQVRLVTGSTGGSGLTGSFSGSTGYTGSTGSFSGSTGYSGYTGLFSGLTGHSGSTGYFLVIVVILVRLVIFWL